MKKKCFKIVILLLLQIVTLNVFCDDPPGVNCNQGDQKPIDSLPPEPEEWPIDSLDVPVQDPSDPNEIIGTKGYDALGDTLQWVAATALLPYTIYFENDPELATAAAQKVEIRCPLHPKVDISTFTVGAFGFGSHIYTVEGNRSTYQQRLDLIGDLGIYVDVVAGIDIVAGEAFWIFQSIDPITLLPPQGTQEGFLPINDENGSGQGFVTFNIKPRSSVCVTGDEITAQASIVFDVNEAIATNVWYNTVDALPPTTQLTGQEGNDNEVLLQFSGSDDQGGCGLKQYKLYVSDNYGAYSLYDIYPVGSEATFPTEYDHCYRFFCLGEDNVGNVEEMKAAAEYEYGNYNLTVSASAYPEDGGTVNGMGIFAYNSTVTLTATPNAGYEFVSWTNQGVTVSTEPTYSFTVTENCQLVAHFEEANLMMQAQDLVQGWNWWSTYIELNGIDGLSMLENSIGQDGLTIKTQNEFIDNYYQSMGYNYWFGSLVNLQNEKCYLINAADNCTAEMTGTLAVPQNHPITIQPNWNWIGYPVAFQQAVGSAFDDFTPSANDAVKGQFDFASYYEGYGWFPDDFMMTPGKGYLYQSNASENKILVYSSAPRNATDLFEEQPHYWNGHTHTYPYNFNSIAIVMVDSVEQRNDKMELGAFVNGECRGSARLRYFAPLDRYFAMLTVTGEAEEDVSFALVDTESGETLTHSDNRIAFAKDVVVGSFDEPYVVHFNTLVGTEEEWAEKLLTLYPNPVRRSQTFSLNIPMGETITELIITDAVGDIVRHETGAIDANTVKGFQVTGVYVIKAIAKSGNIYHGRIIVD